MPRRQTIPILAALAALAACATEPQAQAAAPGQALTGPAAAALETITAADIERHVEYLASDLLRGRDTPSPGLDSAAAYLARQHSSFGLQPGAGDGGFFQRYPLRTVALDTSGVHFGTVLADGSGNEMLAWGRDFYALPGAPGEAMGHARLVRAGRIGASGLPAGDYAGALVVIEIPGAAGRAWNRALGSAIDAARAAGAAGAVLVTDASYPAEAFARQAEMARTAGRMVVGDLDPDAIPAFVLTRAAWARVAARSGVEGHFAAQPMVVSEAFAPNVVAVLPGSDPALRNEYVVLSAHMDHVGVGEPVNGDSIFNGADDDASGTSALLEVAQALMQLPEAQRPRRSVIFLHVSGEELGLLGSRWYSDHPTVPVGNIVANINMDMVGRNSPDTVVVIGKNYSSLGNTANAIQQRHPELGLTLSDDIWPEERFFFRSDHFNFARLEIPALFFFAGVHEDYHRPSDEDIDDDKAARIARMVFHITREVADAPGRPTWIPAGLEEVRALTRQ